MPSVSDYQEPSSFITNNSMIEVITKNFSSGKRVKDGGGGPGISNSEEPY